MSNHFADDDDFLSDDTPTQKPTKPMHDLTIGNICTVKAGKNAGKTVLVIKAGIKTKYGISAITVEYNGEDTRKEDKVWASPEILAFTGKSDGPVAERIKEEDYQDWKARNDAGVPPASQFKKKNNWGKKSY